MNGVIWYGGKAVLRFPSMDGLAIQVGTKLWVYGGNLNPETELRFIRAIPGWKERSGPGFREFRKLKWGTQAKAAKALGLSQPYIAQIESGKRKIPEETVLRYLLERRKPAKALSAEDIREYLARE